MKKIFIVLVVCGLMLVSSNAYAVYYFDSYGIVDQNYGDSWNPATASGIARYSFGFDNPMVNVYEVSLEFETDVFDVSVLVMTPVLPIGWTSSTQTNTGVTFVKDSGVAILYNQGPIIFDVAYTLNDATAYNQTSGDFGSWSEGQAWGQSYSLLGSNNCSSEIAFSPGSTNPVPEPMTMLLFGPALLGLVGLKRKKS